MTIAIGATFPWGRLRNVVTSLPGATLASGAILATDSRWTYADRPPEDMGQKLWRLAPQRGIGAVFAGDVWAAEEALELAEGRIASTSDNNPGTVANLVSEALRDTYAAHLRAAHLRRRPDLGPLYVLIGMANARGQSTLIKFNYATSFDPLLITGVHAIGWPTACEKFRNRLPEIDKALTPSKGNWSLDITEWALQLVAHTFYAAVEPADEPTVGGGVQIVTISPEGWRELKIQSTSDPAGSTGWKEMSANIDDLERWRQRSNVPPLAAGGLPLKFVSFVDEDVTLSDGASLGATQPTA